MKMLKGLAFLNVMRPDLAELETRNIQARVTISICNDRGIPQSKDRWFVVTPRCDRQVELGGMKQDRSSPMPGFNDWNFKTVDGKISRGSDGKATIAGRKSFRLRLQHVEIEDAYTIGCRCQRDPNGPKPPGKTPFCSTSDGVTARRWDGKQFVSIPCEGAGCYLRQYHGEGNKRMRPAKTTFNLIGRLAEDDFPTLLVSVATGSDFNANEFIGLAMATEKQWKDMCDRSGITLPMSWYGIPIDLTVYEATGDESRFPRIHFSLATDLETLFGISINQRMVIERMGRELPAAAHRLLLPEVQEADDAEVFFVPAEVNAQSPARNSLRAAADRARQIEEQTDAGEGNPLDELMDELSTATSDQQIVEIQTRWIKADPSLEADVKALCTARARQLDGE